MKTARRAALMDVFAAGATALCLAAHADHAAAQAADAAKFPSKPIRLIVPFPPGGSNDILGRIIAQKLTERLGQQIVVDNRAGADAMIGTELAARSPPNGHTLLIASSAFSTNAAIHKLAYDPIKSFTPISLLGSGPTVITITPSLPLRSIKELIALARAKPGQLRYASSGIGGINHFGGELFKMMAGVDIVHVPYKGGGPAMVDVIGGHVEMNFGTLIQNLPHMRSGKLRALGVSSLKRSPAAPDVPAISESLPGYEATVWWGILGPAGMPGAIVTKLNTEIGAILGEPETAKRLSAEGAEPLIDSPEAFRKYIVNEIEKWRRVAKQTGIRAE